MRPAARAAGSPANSLGTEARSARQKLRSHGSPESVAESSHGATQQVPISPVARSGGCSRSIRRIAPLAARTLPASSEACPYLDCEMMGSKLCRWDRTASATGGQGS